MLTKFSDNHFVSLTTDNASVNDVLVSTVARCLLARYGIPENKDAHIRCIAHVINLIVQAFLHGLEEVDDDPDIEDYFNTDAPIHYDVTQDKEQVALEDEEFGDEVLQEPEEMKFSEEEESEMIDEVSAHSPLKRVSSNSPIMTVAF